MTAVSTLQEAVRRAAEELSFSGAVRVDLGEDTLVDLAHGHADRAHALPCTPGTAFATASASKTFTALAVLSLAAEGTVDLDAPVRPVLREDLPQVDDRVTWRQLLSHSSGVGEYLDDDADYTDYLMPGGMQDYLSAEDFLPLLDQPMAFEPGTSATYSNAGFVILGLLAERVSGQRFQDLIRTRVIAPAALGSTNFYPTDDLPGHAAIGYLWAERTRTNVFHLPVEGAPDGGAYTTTADLLTFWRALAEGEIVPAALVAEATRVHASFAGDPRRYGLGVWLPVPGVWGLRGSDSGVEMCSDHHPERGLTWSVLSNETEGSWRMAGTIRELLAEHGLAPTTSW